MTKEIDAMLDAFRVAYGYADQYGEDGDDGDNWYCEKLGTWALAWKAATTVGKEACAVIADSQHLKPGLVKGPYVTGWNDAIEYIATAIRARGTDET